MELGDLPQPEREGTAPPDELTTDGENPNEQSDDTFGIPRTDYQHPTQKPEPLLAQIIETSTSPGDTILDPFMGSGTTAVAAIQNDRNYVGFEIDEENYRSVIERRISEATRQMDSPENATQSAESD